MALLMLTIIAISWLLVVLLLGLRTTWHQSLFGSLIQGRLLWRVQPWCLNDNMVTQDEWLHSKPCFTFTNVVIMFHSKRASCSWTFQIKSLFLSMAEGSAGSWAQFFLIPVFTVCGFFFLFCLNHLHLLNMECLHLLILRKQTLQLIN